MSIRHGTNRFITVIQDVVGQTGWVHDHPYVYLLDSGDQVIIGANAPIGTEKLRVVGSIRVDDATNKLAFIEAYNGSNSPVSAASSGRLRYNEATQHWEYSENGGAYASFASIGSLIWTRTGTVIAPTNSGDTVSFTGDTRELTANGTGANVEALGATKVLVVGAASQVQLLDPNGASRDVTLPADNLAGLWYWIQNTGSLGLEQPNGVNCYNLVVKRAGGATVSTIAPGQGVYVKCTGATWIQIDKVDRVVSNATYSPAVLYTDHTTAYTVTSTDSLILIDSTTGIITVTLPAVATNAGRHLHVCDWTRKAGTNKITIAAQGGQTVNGAASVDMTIAGESAYLYCSGTVWNTLSPIS